MKPVRAKRTTSPDTSGVRSSNSTCSCEHGEKVRLPGSASDKSTAREISSKFLKSPGAAPAVETENTATLALPARLERFTPRNKSVSPLSSIKFVFRDADDPARILRRCRFPLRMTRSMAPRCGLSDIMQFLVVGFVERTVFTLAQPAQKTSRLSKAGFCFAAYNSKISLRGRFPASSSPSSLHNHLSRNV